MSASNVDTQALYCNITQSVNDTSLPVRVNNRGVNQRDMQDVSPKMDYQTDVGTITSITAYDKVEELLTGVQFNFLPIEESVLFKYFGADQARHQYLDVDAVSQELRITSPGGGRVNWIAGAYIISTNRFISTGNVFDLGTGKVPEVKRHPLPLYDPQYTFMADQQDILAWAVFGDLIFKMTDKLEADAALRYDNDERKNTTKTPEEFIPAKLQGEAFPGQVRRKTWDELQPKFTLRYKPSEGVMMYAGSSRGFRSGGSNQTEVGAAGIAGINDLFDKETADTVEAGIKAQLLDGKLATSFTAYQTKAKGSYFFVLDPNTSTQNLGNLGEVHYAGFEAEAQSRVTDWLAFYARGGYTDSDIKKSDRTPNDVGNPAPLVAKYTVNLGAQITGGLPFGNELTYFIRPDFQIIGDAWTVTAWSRNLTDQKYNAEWSPGPQNFPNPGYANNFVFKAQPLVWGLDFTYRF